MFMIDGSQQDIGPGDAFAIPPGHDEPRVALDFGQIEEYAKPR